MNYISIKLFFKGKIDTTLFWFFVVLLNENNPTDKTTWPGTRGFVSGVSVFKETRLKPEPDILFYYPMNKRNLVTFDLEGKNHVDEPLGECSNRSVRPYLPARPGSIPFSLTLFKFPPSVLPLTPAMYLNWFLNTCHAQGLMPGGFYHL